MCGIAGKLFLDSKRQVDPRLIDSMSKSMFHRGPDGHGAYVKGAVGLGHRRLSIIDLSRGAQPISNEDGTAHIVFNGEIYNYQELRRILIQRGHTFKSDSDTEVILHAYEEYGADCVKHLRGMFALAIWDEKTQTLFVARDRVGIKPLYYFIDQNTVVFASEVKALLRDPDVPCQPNMHAIGRFLTHYFAAGNETAFVGVRKLPPGHSLTVRGGKVSVEEYWDLEFPRERRSLTLQEAADELLARVREAVRLHMISDVPIGFLLSGGVDSTALLSLAVNETDKQISSFTIGFDGQKFADERPYARLAAQKYGTAHYEMTINSRDFADFLPKYIWHMEEPVCEPPAVALFYISQLASQHVKVLISGEGGDEAFGGYPQYKNIPLFEKLRWALNPLKGVLGSSSTLPPKFRRYLALSNYPFEEYYLSRTATPETRFNKGSGRDLAEVVRPLHAKTRGLDLLSRMLYVDTKTWLPDDLLIKADKITMANSIELRVPLLDHELLEFAASLPSNMKVSGRETKKVLKHAFRNVVPAEILERRKTGFPIPYGAWLQNDLRPFVTDVLLDQRTLQRGYFERPQVESLLAAHKRGEDCSKEVFSLLVLELWHRSFIDGVDAHRTVEFASISHH